MRAAVDFTSSFALRHPDGPGRLRPRHLRRRAGHLKARVPTQRHHDSLLQATQHDTTNDNTTDDLNTNDLSTDDLTTDYITTDYITTDYITTDYITIDDIATDYTTTDNNTCAISIMANIKKFKTTGPQPANKKSKLAPKNPESKASSTEDVSVASAMSPTAPPTPSGFFSLPPELRNEIYRHVLVTNERIKVQPNSSQRSPRRPCHLTVLPALATVSKQMRLETQRIFFEENKFEITPELLKHREWAPLAILHNMHRKLGLEITNLRVCREIQKRCNGHLFRLTGCFTVRKNDTGLSISNEVYSTTYIGRSPRAHPIHVCGCFVHAIAREHTRDPDIVDFLHHLCVAHRASLNGTDMSRRSGGGVQEAVEQGSPCWDCEQRRVSSVAF